MTFDQIMQSVERLGLPGGMLLFGGVGAWWFSRWFAQKVAEPVVAAHLGLVDHVKQTQSDLVETQRQIVTTQTALVGDMQALRREMERRP